MAAVTTALAAEREAYRALIGVVSGLASQVATFDAKLSKLFAEKVLRKGTGLPEAVVAYEQDHARPTVTPEPPASDKDAVE